MCLYPSNNNSFFFLSKTQPIFYFLHVYFPQFWAKEAKPLETDERLSGGISQRKSGLILLSLSSSDDGETSSREAEGLPKNRSLQTQLGVLNGQNISLWKIKGASKKKKKSQQSTKWQIKSQNGWKSCRVGSWASFCARRLAALGEDVCKGS